MATPIALAIAGSEASGGAGAQTDLKTFHELGVFGCTALTCIVSFDPNNNWGHRFVPVDPQVIADQIEAAASVHSHIDAVKIGMLGTPATIEVVSQALDTYKFPQVVLDPVLICKGQEPGAALDVDNALRAQVLPKASIVTPNLFETQVLSGRGEITSVEHRPGCLLRRRAARGAGSAGSGLRASFWCWLHSGRRHYRAGS